jgi:hypothetical protein
MYYKVTLQEYDSNWVYVLTLKKGTPERAEQALTYADDYVSAADKHGIRHYVLYKDGKIIQIQLFQALDILPHTDPGNPASIGIPGMNAIMFGQPPKPTLLITFKEGGQRDGTAYALSPDVFLTYDGDELAYVYILDVYSVLSDVD